MVDEFVSYRLLSISRPRTKLRHSVDHIAHQVEAIEIVEHAHVEGCGRCSFFLVAAHVNVIVPGAPVGQSVNQPRVTMKGKDDGLVLLRTSLYGSYPKPRMSNLSGGFRPTSCRRNGRCSVNR